MKSQKSGDEKKVSAPKKGKLQRASLPSTPPEEDLREKDSLLHLVAENTSDVLWVMNVDGTCSYVSPSIKTFAGYTTEEFVAMRLEDFLAPESIEKAKAFLLEELTRKRTPGEEDATHTIDLEFLCRDGSRKWGEVRARSLRDKTGRLCKIVGVVRDETERFLVEREREAMLELHRLTGEQSGLRSLMQGVTAYLKKWSGCDAIGIRLREGEDYPYYETTGFPLSFLMVENRLCAVDEKGEMLRDSAGNPVIECMCGNILCGRFDPSKPFFTSRGSFWTNSTTELLANTTEADRLTRTRNRCNTQGYESLALVPLRCQGEIFGLLQFNDQRKGRFTKGKIALLERLADTLAVALSQRKTREALEESERRFRALFDGMTSGVAVCQPVDDGADFLITDMNEAGLRICDTTLDQLTGRRVTELFPAVRETGIHDAFRRAWQTGEPQYRPVTRYDDGRIAFWVENRVYRLPGGEIVTVFDDVTARRAAEQSLRESEEMFSKAFYCGPLLMTVSDIHTGKYLEVNENFAGISGYSRDEAIGATSVDLGWITPEDRDSLKKEILANGQISGRELELRKKNGDRIWCLYFGEMITVRGEKRLLSIAHDITERKRAEDAIRETEQRYRSLFESSVDGILMTIPDGQVVDANPAACALFGMTREEICRAGREGLVEPDARLSYAVQQRELTGRFSGELTYLRKNGTTFAGETTSVILLDNAGEPRSFVIIRDITMRKLAMEALSDSENLFRTLSEKSMAGVYVVQDGVFRFVNPNAASYAGYEPAEMIGMPAESPIHPEDRMQSRENARKMLRGELDAPYEFRTVTKQGDTRWVLETVSPIIYEGKRAILGNSMDITVLKVAAEALRLGEEKYRRIVDTANEGIWALDGRQMTNFVNARMAEMLGYTPEEMIGRSVEAFVFEEDLGDHESRMKSRFRGEDGCYEQRFRRKDGGMLWTIVSATALMEEEGRFTGSFAMLTDITERKRAEETLLESKERLDLALRSAGMGTWHWDIVGDRRHFDGQACQLLGLNAVTFTGTADEFFSVVHRDDREKFRTALNRTIEQDLLYEPEYRVVCKDGSIHYIAARGRLIRDDKGRPVRIDGIIWDVTNRKKMEEAFLSSEEKFSKAFNASPDPMAISTIEEGRYIDANVAFFEILGFSRGEIIGQTYAGLNIWADPADRGRLVGELRAAGHVRNMEIIVRTKDGGLLTMLFSAEIIELFGEPHMLAMAKDITERKRAEVALLESEARFRLLVESAPDGLFVQTKGCIRYLNGAALRILGAESQNQLIGRSFLERIHPDFRENVKERARTITEEKKAVPVQDQVYLRLDGTPMDVSVSVVPIHYEGVDGALVFLRDITERKQMEKALRDSEEKYRSLISSMREGVALHEVVYDDRGHAVDYRIIDVNPAYEKHTEIPSDQAKGRLASELYGTGSAPFLDIYVPVAEGGPTQTLEVQFAQMGKQFHVSVSSPREGWFATIFEDITERKQYEDALRCSEEQYRHIFENALEGIFRTSLEGRYLKVNPALARMFGYGSPEEMIEQVTDIGRQLYVDQNDRERCMRLLAEEHSLRRFETRMRRCDGTHIWTVINSQAVRDKAGEVLYIEGMISDISDLKRAEDALKESERRLRQAQKMEAIGTLAGGIAHDFNNILAAIIGYTEMSLCSSVTKKQILENLEYVLKAGLRAKDLIKQILTFSRQSDQELKPISIHSLIKEAVKMLRASLPVTIRIRQNIRAGMGTILADPTQIHQIVMNLATNASHAMGESGGTLGIGLEEITVDAGDAAAIHMDLNAGAYLRLTVSDTGQGIDPSVLYRIFDPFFTTKEPGEGTGMGLAVVHGIVKSHGGVITVESEPGKGTAFEIYFPVMNYESQTAAGDAARLAVGKGKGRILFVDDEEALTLLGGQLLKRLGYEVGAFTNSIEALEAFRTNPDRFDLVITDQTMPQMTGIELAQEMLRIRPDIPIILCTGFSEAVTPEKAKSAGIREYLMKPLVMRQLADTISKTIDTQGELALRYGTHTYH